LDKEARRALAGTLATDDDLLAELSAAEEDAGSYAAVAQLAAAAGAPNLL
jgi:phage shock protein A